MHTQSVGELLTHELLIISNSPTWCSALVITYMEIEKKKLMCKKIDLPSENMNFDIPFLKHEKCDTALRDI